MTDTQRDTLHADSKRSEDDTTRVAREAAMIEAARAEVRNGLALPEERFEQWFDRLLNQAEKIEPKPT